MTYARVKDAYENDGEISCCIDSWNGVMNIVLRDEDIVRAKSELKYNRPIKTKVQRIAFARHIINRIINVSCLGNNDTDMKSAIKKERKRMSKANVQVTWKVYGIDRDKADAVDIGKKLEDNRAEICDAIGQSKSMFTGFCKVSFPKPGKEDDDELTLTGSFKKSLEKDGHLNGIVAIVGAKLKELLAEFGGKDFEIGESEVKES